MQRGIMLYWSRWYNLAQLRKISRQARVAPQYLCDSASDTGAVCAGAYGANIAEKLRDVGVDVRPASSRFDRARVAALARWSRLDAEQRRSAMSVIRSHHARNDATKVI